MKAILIALMVSISATAAAAAEEWPTGPINFIIPWNPGGLNDVLARILHEDVSESLGQPIVHEYRPGAAGRVGMAAAANADPDGYTLVFGNFGPLIIHPILIDDLAYDAQEDFVPVSMLAFAPLALVVGAESEVESLEDLRALAEERSLNFGALGEASPTHIATNLFMEQEGLDGVSVHYEGSSALVPALLSGQLDAAFEPLPSMLPYINDGRARAIAITASSEMDELPGVPSLPELGYDALDIHTWYAIMAPAGTPPEIVTRLADAYAKASETPKATEYFSSQGLIAQPVTVDEIPELMQEESARWRELFAELGVSVN